MEEPRVLILHSSWEPATRSVSSIATAVVSVIDDIIITSEKPPMDSDLKELLRQDSQLLPARTIQSGFDSITGPAIPIFLNGCKDCVSMNTYKLVHFR